jgi:predicted O-methyltransferase YrrM
LLKILSVRESFKDRENAMIVIAWIVAGGITLLLLYILHKVRRVHLMQYDVLNAVQQIGDIKLLETTRQLQILQTLNHELELPQGLPPTRGWAASPDFLLEIARYAQDAKPRIVVECSSGTSTIVLARTLQLNGHGHVYSLEHEPAFAEMTRAHLKRYGLLAYATVLDAPLTPHPLRNENWPWYDISQLPHEGIDMLVIDGPPMKTRGHARYPAGPVLFPRLSADAAVFLDDAARDDEKNILLWWGAEFPDLALSTPFTEKGCAVLRKPHPL